MTDDLNAEEKEAEEFSDIIAALSVKDRLGRVTMTFVIYIVTLYIDRCIGATERKLS